MIEALVLGAIQGIIEWLPVSSEGIIVLTQVHIFGATNIVGALDLALFLHVGTLFSAVVYFRKDIARLFTALVQYEDQDNRTQRTLIFLLISTLVSGVLGFFLLRGVRALDQFFEFTGKGISLIIGFALLLTAFFLYTRRIQKDEKTEEDLSFVDSLILGIGQGLSVIPGLSRSGTTVSLFLLRSFSEEIALKLSFIMSIPIVSAGALLLLFEGFELTYYSMLALLSSFVFGLLTISGLMKLARRINFAHFVLVFAILTLISVFI